MLIACVNERSEDAPLPVAGPVTTRRATSARTSLVEPRAICSRSSPSSKTERDLRLGARWIERALPRREQADEERLEKITKRFTVHGLRYTFTDLVRRANVDAVVRRALTGHVTEEMQRHYSTVGMDEKRAAVAGVLRLVPPERKPGGNAGGSSGGSALVPTERVG